MSQTLQIPNVPRFLTTVPFEQGFHFYTNPGEYTGITATSLSEFAAKLETVDVESVLYHYPRGDFQKWIEDTLGDRDLAEKMCFVKSGLSEETLRKHILGIVQNRLKDLKEQA
jgi:hypothetical protein